MSEKLGFYTGKCYEDYKLSNPFSSIPVSRYIAE